MTLVHHVRSQGAEPLTQDVGLELIFWVSVCRSLLLVLEPRRDLPY